MKKLKLEIDALRVESFEPHARPEQGRGTVEAREAAAGADTSVKVPCFCSERQTCWDCT
jgi:hypothetical protein